MSLAEDELEPIRGQSRVLLVVTAVMLGIGVVGLVATLIGSLTSNLLAADLEPTAIGLASYTGVAAIGFVIALVQRRAYLRDVRNGRVVVRRPWRGEGLGPSV